MNNAQFLGSQTAKNGFRNEDDVVEKFNHWQTDEDAQQWLLVMQYDLQKIEFVKAVKISGHKTDVQVQITIKLKEAIDCQNLQVKLVSNPRDKRRMFANEFSKEEQKQVLEWLNANKSLIVSDVLKGRGQFSAEWMLVIQKVSQNAIGY